jgi:fibronectin type 3 domain-containing protein
VNLSWTSVSGAVSYNVYRSTSATGSFSVWLSGTTSLSASDNSIKNNETFRYYVVAVSACGTPGSASNTFTAIN